MNAAIPRFDSLIWPDAGSFWIADARIPRCLIADARELPVIDPSEGTVSADLLIENGRLARIVPPGAVERGGARVVELQGRQVWPMLVDIHTHLDRGQTVMRAPNVSGTMADALKAVAEDRARWTASELMARIDFGLRCAYAHGVSAIRTHIDSIPAQADRSWSTFRTMRAEWADRITLQGVSLIPIDAFRDGGGDRLAAMVAQSGGVLGAVTRASSGVHGDPMLDLDMLLDRFFGLAARHDLDIDLHVDESGDPRAAALPRVARAALRNGYRGRVTAGHCCSLAVQSEDEADRTMDLVAEADIAIVTLPPVNMYLQDRIAGRTPRWRGVTPVQELQKRGVRVAAAGDNCRDSFHPYGDHDMVDTFRQAVRILHLDHPVGEAPALVGANPAAMGRLPEHGRLVVGAPARLMVFNARTLNEILSRPQADRVILDHGRRSMAEPPDYSELWD